MFSLRGRQKGKKGGREGGREGGRRERERGRKREREMFDDCGYHYTSTWVLPSWEKCERKR